MPAGRAEAPGAGEPGPGGARAFLASFFAAGHLAAYTTKVVVASVDGDDEAPDWPDSAAPVAVALLALGTIALPMALLSLAVNRTVWALNPVTVARGLAATWRVYPVALLAMVLAYAGVSVLQLLPGAGLVVGSFLSLWLLLVEMRILGLLYRTHSDRFGWP